MTGLFTYGTLTSPEVACALTGANAVGSAIPVFLRNHRRVRLRKHAYPSVVVAEGYDVVGLVFPDLDAFAWRVIDAYEGAEYELVDATVRMFSGEFLEVKMFRLKGELGGMLTDEDWDLDVWAKENLAKAVSSAVECRAEQAALLKREFLIGLGEGKYHEGTMLKIATEPEKEMDVEAVVRDT